MTKEEAVKQVVRDALLTVEIDKEDVEDVVGNYGSWIKPHSTIKEIQELAQAELTRVLDYALKEVK